MKLIRIEIRNYRLLRRITLNLAEDSTTTVLVGPNNCGKTSITDAIRCFTHYGSADRRGFNIHDISKSRMPAFDFVERKLNSAIDDESRMTVLRRYLPVIRLSLTFEYSDTPEEINIARTLMMDLEPTNNEVNLRMEFSITNALMLLNDYQERRKPKETSLYDVIASNLHRYYGFTFSKVSADGLRVQLLDDGSIISQLIHVDTISAQRHLADEESGRSTRISRLLHDHYSTYYRKEDTEGYQAIEDAILDSSKTLTRNYENAFSRLIERLRDFGYPQGTSKPDMKIKAEMNSATIYRDNTRIYYSSPLRESEEEFQPTYELPERYNGLGYKNLIYIVLKLESFRSKIEVESISPPGVHLICIEEPEVHLHPQMQTVFIKEISRVLSDDSGTTAQVILSTHSPYIVVDSGFSPVRYFKRNYGQVQLRDLSRLPLEENDHPDVSASTLTFLRRYIKHAHCDLLFADKAILVEGQVERLLLPTMIEQVAEQDGFYGFDRQYISILEIGGRHAHMIDPFLRFIGIPTLVIADIDSANADGNKCPVSEGKFTTNGVIKYWLPEMNKLQNLHEADEQDKINGNFYIAYQVHENGHCGRSFEEAFVYANLDWIPENVDEFIGSRNQVARAVKNDLSESAYDFGARVKKVDFALDLMAISGWRTPAYIAHGLEWLSLQELTI